MRGTPRLCYRTRRLAATMTRGDLRAEAARLVAELGIPAEQLWAEAEMLARRFGCGDRGDPRAVCEAVASERGLEPEAVWTETQRILAGWGG